MQVAMKYLDPTTMYIRNLGNLGTHGQVAQGHRSENVQVAQVTGPTRETSYLIHPPSPHIEQSHQYNRTDRTSLLHEFDDSSLLLQKKYTWNLVVTSFLAH